MLNVYVIMARKYEKDTITNSWEKNGYTISSIISMWRYFLMLKGS